MGSRQPASQEPEAPGLTRLVSPACGTSAVAKGKRGWAFPRVGASS